MLNNCLLFVGGLHEVSGFILLALVLASVGIGAFSTYLYLYRKRISAGVFEINRNDPSKDLFTLHLDYDPDLMKDGQLLIFEVREHKVKGEKE